MASLVESGECSSTPDIRRCWSWAWIPEGCLEDPCGLVGVYKPQYDPRCRSKSDFLVDTLLSWMLA